MTLGLGLLENEGWKVVLGKINFNGLKIRLKNRRKWNEVGSSMFYWIKFWAKAQTRKSQESNQNRAGPDWFSSPSDFWPKLDRCSFLVQVLILMKNQIVPSHFEILCFFFCQMKILCLSVKSCARKKKKLIIGIFMLYQQLSSKLLAIFIFILFYYEINRFVGYYFPDKIYLFL